MGERKQKMANDHKLVRVSSMAVGVAVREHENGNSRNELSLYLGNTFSSSPDVNAEMITQYDVVALLDEDDAIWLRDALDDHLKLANEK